MPRTDHEEVCLLLQLELDAEVAQPLHEHLAHLGADLLLQVPACLDGLHHDLLEHAARNSAQQVYRACAEGGMGGRWAHGEQTSAEREDEKYERYPSTTHLSTLPMANGGGEIIALAAWQRMLKMLRYSRGGT